MILVYCLIAVMPLANHPLWNEYVGEMTTVKYLGGACLLYALSYWNRRFPRPEFFRAAHVRCFVVFFLLMSVSYVINGPSFTIVDNKVITYLAFALLFFVILIAVDSLERLRWVLLTTVGSVAFASLYLLREWQKGSPRPGWVVGDANYFTATACLALPVAVYLMSGSTVRWERLFCAGSMGLTAAAVNVGGSRGGFLSLVVSSLFMIARSRDRWRNLGLALALCLTLGLLVEVSPLERLLNPSEPDQFGADSRLVLWSAGSRIMLANPLFGVGLANFLPSVVREGIPHEMAYIAHNMYLEIGTELGIPALLAFLAMFPIVFRELEAIRRRTAAGGPLLLHQAALGIQAGLLGFVVAGFFVSAQYQKIFWLMLSIAACLDPLERFARMQGEPAPPLPSPSPTAPRRPRSPEQARPVSAPHPPARGRWATGTGPAWRAQRPKG
jgi:putative inorganic carbon (hco3(-)) transporter